MYQLILHGARLGDEVLGVGVQDGRIVRISSRIEEGGMLTGGLRSYDLYKLGMATPRAGTLKDI